MEEIRCAGCGRKLAEGRYTELRIKCPRCGALNILKAMSLKPERHRASLGETHGKASASPESGRSVRTAER